MSEFKWQIETIRSVLFFNEPIEFKKKEWSFVVTNKDHFIASSIVEEHEVEKQYTETTELDDFKQFNLVHVNDMNIIDLQYQYNENEKFYSISEIVNEIDDFKAKTKQIYSYFPDKLIRMGSIMQVSVPLGGNETAAKILQKNIPTFASLDTSFEEINIRANKPISKDGVRVNCVFQFAEGEKISLGFDSQMKTPQPKLQKRLVHVIDINTDVGHRDTLPVETWSEHLHEELVKAILNGAENVRN